MATHHIYTTVKAQLPTFKSALGSALEGLGWEYEYLADNYLKIRATAAQIYEATKIIPNEELVRSGLSDLQRWNAQLSSKITSAMNVVSQQVGFFGKYVKFSENLAKGLIDNTADGYYYPELIFTPNESSVDLSFSIKSIAGRNTLLILTQLAIKSWLERHHRIQFSEADYQVQTLQSGYRQQQLPEHNSQPRRAATEPPRTNRRDTGPTEAFITRLKIQVADNDINGCMEALDALYAKVQGSMHEEFLLLKSDLARLRKDSIAGLITYEQAEVKRNQINHRLLQLVNLLLEDDAVVYHLMQT